MNKIKRKIKAVVFDLDDTLYPERSWRNSGFRFIADKLKKKGFPVTFKKISGLYREYPQTLFNELAARYNLPYSADYLIDEYRRHFPRIKLYPEARKMLKALKKEYQLGLLTDYFHLVQANKVKALGISAFFDFIVYTDKIRASKPETKGFKLIKRKLKAGDWEIMYVGDNEEKDFLGAKKSGFLTVKFANRRGFHNHKKMPKAYKAHFEINELFKLPALLEKLS
ncbi:MAG: HAD family hydrolase [Patescibacteria group bacterium]